MDSTDHKPLIDEGSDIKDQFDEQVKKNSIHKAIASLPHKQSDAITLYYLKEFQYSEVAEIMNIPINTVKSHLRRAKENLRQILQEHDVWNQNMIKTPYF